jgi:GT2 family glycosyltransferase
MMKAEADVKRRIDISVVVVNWNTRALLMKCLESIKRDRTRYELEMVVVDNGSVDDSVATVRQVFPDVKVIENHRNLGFAKANNIGISQSSGRYVCLVNSDVQIIPGCIERLASCMDENPGTGISGPKILWPDLTAQDSCRKFPGLWIKCCEVLALNRLFPRSPFFSGEHMKYFAHDKTIQVDSLAGCFLMIRRKALDQTGLFDEQFFIYAEETDLCKRFWEKGWRVIFVSDAVAIHHCGASSSREPLRFSLEQQRSILKYWTKHHSWFARSVLLFLIGSSRSFRLVAGIFMYAINPSQRPKAIQIIHKNYACMEALFDRQ